MAGGQERILRRRIKSVQSTKKITRAMELIAASRIVKAQARVQAAQPYADGITEVVRDLQAAGAGSNNAFLVPRPQTRRVGEVVIAADRGLCGAYNSSVIRAAEADVRAQQAQGRDTAIVTVEPRLPRMSCAMAMSSSPFNERSSMRRMRSPPRSPAFSAGEPGITPRITSMLDA